MQLSLSVLIIVFFAPTQGPRSNDIGQYLLYDMGQNPLDIQTESGDNHH
jgi:hypothetical protein